MGNAGCLMMRRRRTGSYCSLSLSRGVVVVGLIQCTCTLLRWAVVGSYARFVCALLSLFFIRFKFGLISYRTVIVARLVGSTVSVT